MRGGGAKRISIFLARATGRMKFPFTEMDTTEEGERLKISAWDTIRFCKDYYLPGGDVR